MLPAFIFLSGCWDYKDLNEAIIPIVAAYDISEDKRFNYTVTTFSPNIEPEAERDNIIISKDFLNAGEFRQRLAHTSGRNYVLGRLETIIISEELARKGVGDVFDTLFRTPQIRYSLLLGVVEDRADEFMHFEEKEEKSLGKLLSLMLSVSQMHSFIPTTTLHELGIGINDIGYNPVIPTLKVQNNRVVLSGVAIFKSDKLIDKIDMDETRSLSLLRGIDTFGYIRFVVKEDGKIIDTGTVRGQNSRKVSVKRKDDTFIFTIDIDYEEAELIEHTGTQKINEEHLQKIEKNLAADIKEECEQFIKKMQTVYKFDCIDITRFAQAKWRKEIRDKIDNGFIEDAKINVNVSVDVQLKGETY
ncbi:Ger(x)C family spore germination protein [Candidatus Syntrophocurvum alkaliphilum]|nr:Ger(x)C family spore germination protein [Candidatus Syntrophocurvum alkaliphilum]